MTALQLSMADAWLVHSVLVAALRDTQITPNQKIPVKLPQIYSVSTSARQSCAVASDCTRKRVLCPWHPAGSVTVGWRHPSRCALARVPSLAVGLTRYTAVPLTDLLS